MNRREFESAVEEALDRLPLEFAELMSNIAIQVEESPDNATMRDVGLDPRRDSLFGLYTGVPLPERSAFEPPLYPDQIYIFQQPLQEICDTVEELEEEIEITVVHEVAHYLGIDEDRLTELGYE